MEIDHTKLPDLKPIIIREPIRGNKTVVVLGVNRSCTSIASGLIDGLGVPMDDSQDGHFERILFKDTGLGCIISDEINKLNESFNNWGVQIKHDKRSAERICRKLRNPHLIIVFRDPIANAQRLLSAELSNEHPLHAVYDVVKRQKELLHMIALPYPILLLSCERLRYESDVVINDICKFIDVKHKPEASDIIGKNGGYLIQN